MNPVTGYIVAAALVLSVLVGFISYFVGYRHANAAAQTVISEYYVEQLNAYVEAQQRIQELERDLATASNTIAEEYERGKREAEAVSRRVVTELRAGTLELQKRWTGCEAERMRDSTPSPSELDAAARDREESAARIVRAAAECDAQVLGLQGILSAERELLNERENSSRR